jgi:ectoine hydroxylase-related dioxygenase (phytanoyl-CoA dioxygenase family)
MEERARSNEVSHMKEGQSGYVAPEPLTKPDVLPLPAGTTNMTTARESLRELGCCIVTDVLSPAEIQDLKTKMDAQYEAEQRLGELCPDRGSSNKIVIPNLVNKGEHYLDLITREETEALASFMLGKNWLLSSLTAHMFTGTTPGEELVHRDQGQVPASVEFPALLNLFYLLDDFTPERGSTVVFPGSHRWPLEHRVHPPKPSLGHQVTIPAGSLFAFEGRLWHATGANHSGHRRRALSVFCSAPWLRQQENALASTARHVLESSSSQLQARLGLKTYGTLGNVNGTRVTNQRVAFGSVDVGLPDYLIGENAELIPMGRNEISGDNP